MKRLVKKSIITTAEAEKKGISRSLLHYYVKTAKYERVAKGVYVNKSTTPEIDFEFEDLVYEVLSIKNGIITGISALAIYEITEEIPRNFWIAIPNNTSASPRTNVRYIRTRNHKLGKTIIKIGKVSVPIYDIERTLVDAFKYSSIETAIKALKYAFSGDSKNKPDIKKILGYAKKLRVNIEPYLITVTTV